VRSGQTQPLPRTHPCVDEIGMRLVLSDDHQTRARSAEIRMEVE
jgi:hypothetical protein